MKTLADQLRRELENPATKPARTKKAGAKANPAILDALLAYDTSKNKIMVHTRFSDPAVRLMNQFKLATRVDASRLVAFAVQYLFENNPDLRKVIRDFLQNSDL